MKMLIYPIFVLFPFMLTSCDAFLYEPLESKIALSSIVSIKTDNNLSNSYGENPDDYSVLFGFHTDKIYKCPDKIASDISVHPGHIKIDIKGIERDKECLLGPGPATIGLVTKLPDGIYDMDISYRGNKDTYSVNKEGFKISITQQDATFSYYQSKQVNFYQIE